MRVAIIGAGAAGLNALRHCLDSSYNFSCEVFEQTNLIGGTWVYTEETGTDKEGLPIHTSMYKDLRTNLPKEIMHFPDFKFPENDYSFITQKEVLQYLHDYVHHFNLTPHIKFHHQVLKVKPVNTQWLVTVKNLLTQKTDTQEYDAVIVGNGHYSKPHWPNIPGKDIFKGKLIHSRDYRDSRTYQGEKVLVLGAGASGKDIALHLAKDAAKVFLSHRHKKITTEFVVFPENVEQVPGTVSFEENAVVLANNTKVFVDSVIICTGYKYDYPFLTEDSNITVDDNWVKPLYKHLINIEKPTISFPGIPFLVIPFPLCDYQNRVFLNYLKGSITLPSREDMYKDTEIDMNSRWEKGYPKKHAHRLGFDYQEKYFDDLAKLGNLEPLQPVILKLYNTISGKIRRHLRFKIVDEENFIQLNN